MLTYELAIKAPSSRRRYEFLLLFLKPFLASGASIVWFDFGMFPLIFKESVQSELLLRSATDAVHHHIIHISPPADHLALFTVLDGNELFRATGRTDRG